MFGIFGEPTDLKKFILKKATGHEELKRNGSVTIDVSVKSAIVFE